MLTIYTNEEYQYQMINMKNIYKYDLVLNIHGQVIAIDRKDYISSYFSNVEERDKIVEFCDLNNLVCTIQNFV